MAYRNPEQNEILGTFMDLLSVPTGDGGNKRAAGQKVHWKVDPGHAAAALRHHNRWENGERYDIDSGAHHLVHEAWRLLAIAVQEMIEDGLFESNPRPVLPQPLAPEESPRVPAELRGPAELPRESFDVV